jgi:hypothetical protein
VIDEYAESLPPTVADVCATHGLTTCSVDSQGPYWQALLVV